MEEFEVHALSGRRRLLSSPQELFSDGVLIDKSTQRTSSGQGSDRRAQGYEGGGRWGIRVRNDVNSWRMCSTMSKKRRANSCPRLKRSQLDLVECGAQMMERKEKAIDELGAALWLMPDHELPRNLKDQLNTQIAITHNFARPPNGPPARSQLSLCALRAVTINRQQI